MKAVVAEDLIKGRVSGIGAAGVEIPSSLRAFNPEDLRYDGAQIIDAATITSWHIDPSGQKRLNAAADRQALTCAFADELINEAGLWRVKTQADQLWEVRARAKTAMASYSETVMTRIIGDVPQSERDSWPTKELAARAIKAGGSLAEDMALLQSEANISQETVLVLADRIIANANGYRIMIGTVAGLRRNADAAITAASSSAAVDQELAAHKTALDQAINVMTAV